jgi:hypothetical protein
MQAISRILYVHLFTLSTFVLVYASSFNKRALHCTLYWIVRKSFCSVHWCFLGSATKDSEKILFFFLHDFTLYMPRLFLKEKQIPGCYTYKTIGTTTSDQTSYAHMLPRAVATLLTKSKFHHDCSLVTVSTPKKSLCYWGRSRLRPNPKKKLVYGTLCCS